MATKVRGIEASTKKSEEFRPVSGQVYEKNEVSFRVRLPRELFDELYRMLGDRKVEMNTFLRLAIRNMQRSVHHYQLGDKIRFGKYAGELIDTIIRTDPAYVDWCINNLGTFTLTDEAMDLLGNMQDPPAWKDVC